MVCVQLAIDVRGQQKLFKYDRVFGDCASQAQVYEDTKPLVRSVLDGELLRHLQECGGHCAQHSVLDAIRQNNRL
jgi:hypothetical protein